jgi:hypothetical protein
MEDNFDKRMQALKGTTQISLWTLVCYKVVEGSVEDGWVKSKTDYISEEHCKRAKQIKEAAVARGIGDKNYKWVCVPSSEK